MTESDLNKVSTFHTKNLLIIWSETISNQHLLTRCNQDGMGTDMMRTRWRWIGHMMRREPGNVSFLHWTPKGKRKRGRLKNTCRRNVEGDHHTWGTVQKLVQNRQEWGTFVAALHASRDNGHECINYSLTTPRISYNIVSLVTMIVTLLTKLTRPFIIITIL